MRLYSCEQNLLLLVFTAAVALASSCFIINCPRGGKRSMDSPPTQSVRQCMKCGPGDLGQCFGPNICCGELIGCHIRTLESAACAKEDLVPIPCEVRGRACADGRGRCGADGICCNEETCTIDEECRTEGATIDKENAVAKRVKTEKSQQLEELLQRLLARERSVRASVGGLPDAALTPR